MLRRVMGAVAPVAVVNGVENDRERLAALGQMAAGLTHELNNPAAAARRAAAQLEEAHRTPSPARSPRSSTPASSARTRPCSSACSARRWTGWPRGRRSTRSTPPTPRRRCSSAWRTTASRGVALRRRARRRRRRRGVGRPRRRDRGQRRRTRRSAGSSASLTAQCSPRTCRRPPRRMSDLVGAVKSYAYMDRGELRDRHARGPGVDADDARPQAQAHPDRHRARLRRTSRA